MSTNQTEKKLFLQEKLEMQDAIMLADLITGIDNPEMDLEISNEALAEKYNLYIEDFHSIANNLFQHINFGMSPLTHRAYVGIGDNNTWIVKKQVTEFIPSIIYWLTEGEDDIPADKKGYRKTITINDEPVFDIQITRHIKKPSS